MSPGEQHFYPNKLQCLSLVGSRCNIGVVPGEYALHCLENAECRGNMTDIYGSCACANGFKADDTNTFCLGDASEHRFSKFLLQFSLALIFVASEHFF